MKKDYFKVALTIFLLSVLFIYFIFVKKNIQETYNCLLWNDNCYYITYEIVSEEYIGDLLGSVKHKVEQSKFPTNNDESNLLDENSKIFSFINVLNKNPNEHGIFKELVVQFDKDIYYKAYIIDIKK